MSLNLEFKFEWQPCVNQLADSGLLVPPVSQLVGSYLLVPPDRKLVDADLLRKTAIKVLLYTTFHLSNNAFPCKNNLEFCYFGPGKPGKNLEFYFEKS